ncbi:MAG TPA: chorismate mutase [Xenococcaceae cyanobacterium]
MEWKVRGIRGATTVAKNSRENIQEAVTELLDEIETHNQFEAEDIICVFFTVTSDLNSLFPAAIARNRPGWDKVPLLDLQQMYVPGSLEQCIRVLIQVNTLQPQSAIIHCYLRDAEKLRPDLSLKEYI